MVVNPGVHLLLASLVFCGYAVAAFRDAGGQGGPRGDRTAAVTGLRCPVLPVRIICCPGVRWGRGRDSMTVAA